MRPFALLMASLGFVCALTLAITVSYFFSLGHSSLEFILSAICGTQTGIIFHHKHPGAISSLSAKIQLGLALAVCTVTSGIIIQSTAHLYKNPEISIPFSAVGSFFYPFILFKTFWTTLSKSKEATKNNSRDM